MKGRDEKKDERKETRRFGGMRGIWVSGGTGKIREKDKREGRNGVKHWRI